MPKDMSAIYAIIMAGGSGTRFWPASRRGYPKQLLAIAPGTKHSLLSKTVERIRPLCAPEDILIATGERLMDVMRKDVPELPASSFLGEPVARNTAPCIGWAASVVARRDPDALVMVLPADQHIGDEDGFRDALQRALDSAAAGTITTIGIRPTRPETGYGYIESGEELEPGLRRVKRFVEKPDRHRAKRYMKSGEFFWNAGMFFFRSGAMLDAISRHMPDLSEGLKRIADATSTPKEQETLREVFDGLQSVSIDYGVMEKEEALNVVIADFGWSDLGSWQTAWELGHKDADDNVMPEQSISVDARGNLVYDARTDQSGALTALVGVENLCIVHTDDATLVIPRERAQDVREVVAELERRGGDKL